MSQTDIVIIGDGIAGLSLAYMAARNNLNCIVLGKNLPGATNAATGFLAPRPDYILRDLELVRRTAYECGRWRGIFDPQIVKSNLFLIPIGPDLPESVERFEALLDFYDKETGARLSQLPNGYFKINQTILEKMEPNLKKGVFNGALALWEFIVDTVVLLEKMNEIVINMNVEKINIKKIINYEKSGDSIKKLEVIDACDNIIKINEPRIIVNAAGSWIPEVWKLFGIDLAMDLVIGVQAKIPGWYFQSGIITFGPDKKYVACIQKNGYAQVGPTNGTDDIDYLHSVFTNLVEGPINEASFLKSGYRVKPFIADSQRPVIWSHCDNGFDNLYSVHPGKMVLALLAADELLIKAQNDGRLPKNIKTSNKDYHLKGESRFFSEFKIRFLAVKSFFSLALFYLQFLCKPRPFLKERGKRKPHN